MPCGLRANGAEDGASAARSFQSGFASSTGQYSAATAKQALAFVPSFRLSRLRASRFRVFRPSMFSASRPLCPPHPARTPSPTTLRIEGTNHGYMRAGRLNDTGTAHHNTRTKTHTGTFRFRQVTQQIGGAPSLPSFQVLNLPTTLASDRLLITAADTKNAQRGPQIIWPIAGGPTPSLLG
jgi:hypothetical protein